MSRPLVILDRDGVINRDSHTYIKHQDEWIPLAGAVDAIARLSNAGYDVAIATNQSGVARGLIPLEELEAMHARMVSLVEAAGGHIAHIAYCPHGPDDACRCRKPLPGMLHHIAQALGKSDLSDAWMVGDSLRDLQAGEAAGTHLALVLTGNGHDTQSALSTLTTADAVWVCDDLADFVARLLATAQGASASE